MTRNLFLMIFSLIFFSTVQAAVIEHYHSKLGIRLASDLKQNSFNTFAFSKIKAAVESCKGGEWENILTQDSQIRNCVGIVSDGLTVRWSKSLKSQCEFVRIYGAGNGVGLSDDQESCGKPLYGLGSFENEFSIRLSYPLEIYPKYELEFRKADAIPFLNLIVLLGGVETEESNYNSIELKDYGSCWYMPSDKVNTLSCTSVYQ